jgi:hypothetical protein
MGNPHMRQKHTGQIIFEELSIDIRFVAVFQDQIQLPSDLHAVRLQIPANSRGVLRRHHIRGETRRTREDASHDRDMFRAPR